MKKLPASMRAFFPDDPEGVEWVEEKPRNQYDKPIVVGGGKVQVSTKPKKADFNNRTRDYLRGLGYHAVRVDYFDHLQKRQHDLFGIFDFVGLGEHTVGVQVTSKANQSARINKIKESPFYTLVQKAGWKILVLGWWKNSSGRYEVSETWI